MDHFFDLVNGKMQSLDLSTKPSHIFNVDETSFASRTSTEKVFAVIIINLSDNNYFSQIQALNSFLSNFT